MKSRKCEERGRERSNIETEWSDVKRVAQDSIVTFQLQSLEHSQQLIGVKVIKNNTRNGCCC